MTADFLLAAAKPQRRIPPHAVALIQRGEPVGVNPRPLRHDHWVMPGGRLRVGAWTSEEGAPPWCQADEGRVVIVTGWAQRRWEPWRSPDVLAAELAGASAGPLQGLADELVGMYTVTAIESDGHAFLTADPFGLGFFFTAESADHVVVGSRPELVAQAAAEAPGRPELDPLAVVWLAYSRYHIGERTGFAGVRLAAPGETFRHGSRSGPLFRRDSVLAAPAREQGPPASPAELVEEISGGLTSSLAAFLTTPADVHYADLTGGQDSRLLLGVILAADMQDQFRFRTVGPPDLADVQIASEIAELFGLDHVVEFGRPEYDQAYPERAREFVAATAGLNSLWDLHAPENRPAKQHLSGLGGEFLTSWEPPKRSFRSTDEPATFIAERCNRLGLVPPDLATQYCDFIRREVERGLIGSPAPIDRYDSFQIANSQRHRFGLLERLRTDRWTLPLTDVEVVGRAFRMGGEERKARRLHREIIGSSSVQLLQHRLAGRGWPGPERGPAAPPAPVQTPRDPLMARLYRAASEERTEFVADVISDSGNPAWDMIDRGRLVQALADWDSIHNLERQEALGAVTAAVWLG